MPKVSALPEDVTPTLDDYTYNLDNTATTAEKTKWSNVLKMLIGGIYPVGCIYTETTGTNPGTTFGFGTWAAYGAGRVLIGAGTSDQTFSAGATGGESNHVLSASEMPVHNHGVTDPGHGHGVSDPGHAHAMLAGVHAGGGGVDWTNNGGSQHGSQTLNWSDGWATGAAATGIGVVGSGTGISTQNAGSGATHNNLPPYTVVYFWQRTA